MFTEAGLANVLVSWIGITDLRAAEGHPDSGLGPIGQAVAARSFDRIMLLADLPKPRVQGYVSWLKQHTSAGISLNLVKLSGPTDFGEIYEAAAGVISRTLQQNGNADLVFHLSPGTPAMAAVWIILGKTRFPAELIESSKEKGVRTASVPFDISADFIPSLLRRSDQELERLSLGLPPEAPEFNQIACRSKAMQRTIIMARKAAPRSVPILIEGASGTGKELLARAIHMTSPRAKSPFVAVNCGAVPLDLFESEFFGHTKGAFTGSASDRIGYFQAAHQGTLFLDEIGELPLPAQVKLLRTLQEGEITRLGESKPISVNFRVISATNRNLIAEMGKGNFREDLYYRLAVAVLRLPPLKERSGDLSLLIDKLLEQINQESATEPGYQYKKLSAGARNLLLAHDWPGNVRELQNTLRRAAVWCPGDRIETEDIRDALLPISSTARREMDILGYSLSEPIDLRAILDKVAQHYLKKALDESQGNKTRAAQLLGLPSYQTLTNWLARYGVKG
jgi:DNA-binding NtrC family response regulator